MTAADGHFQAFPPAGQNSLGSGHGGNGLEGGPQHDGRAGGNTAQNSPGVVRFPHRRKTVFQCPRPHGIVILGTEQARGGKAFPHFHAFDRAHAHERLRQDRVQFVEHGFTQSGGHAEGFHRHHAAQRVALSAGGGHKFIPEGDHGGGCRAIRAIFRPVQIVFRPLGGKAANLGGECPHPNAVNGQQSLGHCSARHSGGGLTP